jgi:hypothetical protein
MKKLMSAVLVHYSVIQNYSNILKEFPIRVLDPDSFFMDLDLDPIQKF